MPTNSDVLIIGGGHNGLVCASYLAAAGLKVTILERRRVVGGAAVTEEFHPGFRNSVASYTVSLLNPKVIRDLDLHAHGLRIVEREVSNFLPTEDGRYLATGGGRTKDEVAKFSRKDAERLIKEGVIEPGYEVLNEVITGRDGNKVVEPLLVEKRLANGMTGKYIKRAVVNRDPTTGEPEIDFRGIDDNERVGPLLPRRSREPTDCAQETRNDADGLEQPCDVDSVVVGEKLSADLAFWNIPGEDAVFPGIPYVAFSVKF